MAYLDDLMDLLAGQTSSITVGTLEERIAKLVRSETRFVSFSSQTFHEQVQKHPDIKTRDFAFLPRIINNGLVIQEHSHPERLNICYQRRDGKRFAVTIKATKDGRKLFLISFRRIRKRNTRSLLRRGRRLRNHR